MTLFLASVTNADEASLAAACGADIIDAKDPGRGALGAVAPEALARIIESVGGAHPVSATIGDLPMEPAPIARAVAEKAEAGAAYVKFGIFSPDGLDGCAQAACEAADGKAKVFAVFFADLPFTPAMLTSVLLARLKKGGLAGVMLDTADKTRGRLPEWMAPGDLESFARSASRQGLSCGLAGSLRRSDIQSLLEVEPDFLGFRGALCSGETRNGRLDADAIRAIAALIKDRQLRGGRDGAAHIRES